MFKTGPIANELAKKLLNAMPNLNLKVQEIDDIIEYLKWESARGATGSSLLPDSHVKAAKLISWLVTSR